jgi:hypothetical protein
MKTILHMLPCAVVIPAVVGALALTGAPAKADEKVDAFQNCWFDAMRYL